MESTSRSRSLVEHDLFGKPVSTFPDHALKIHVVGLSARSAVKGERHSEKNLRAATTHCLISLA
jgi:hypothetical protein